MKVVHVFATDDHGLHQNAEAARAVDQWGALTGICEGPSGNSYAIPVYDSEGKAKPIEQLRGPIRRLLEYMNKNKKVLFEVGRIGCGPYGYDDFDVAPYFVDAPSNATLPVGWRTHYQDYGNKS